MGQTRVQVNARQRRTLQRMYEIFEPGIAKEGSVREFSSSRTFYAFQHDIKLFENIGILERNIRGGLSIWKFPMTYADAYRRLRGFQKVFADEISQKISTRTKEVKPWKYTYRHKRIIQETEEVVVNPSELSKSISESVEEEVLLPLITALQTAINQLSEMREREKV